MRNNRHRARSIADPALRNPPAIASRTLSRCCFYLQDSRTESPPPHSAPSELTASAAALTPHATEPLAAPAPATLPSSFRLCTCKNSGLLTVTFSMASAALMRTTGSLCSIASKTNENNFGSREIPFTTMFARPSDRRSPPANESTTFSINLGQQDASSAAHSRQIFLQRVPVVRLPPIRQMLP